MRKTFRQAAGVLVALVVALGHTVTASAAPASGIEQVCAMVPIQIVQLEGERNALRAATDYWKALNWGRELSYFEYSELIEVETVIYLLDVKLVEMIEFNAICGMVVK